MSKNPVWMKAMFDPATYPHSVEKVDLVQTHISWIFLAGSRVYKIKKPVDFGFLNFTTLEKRHHFCKEELRLNKRLCPEIYLEVEPLIEDSKGIHIGGKGKVLEWILIMKRMPEKGMMKNLIQRDLLTKEHIRLITQRLIPFYTKADRGDWVQSLGGLDVVRQNTEENFDQTRSFVNDLIDPKIFEHIQNYTREFEKRHEDLFKKRVEERWIVEGHGDLYSANICFGPQDKVYIFDCIEFNERFRCGDVANDIAFLAMDLDFHGLLVHSDQVVSSISKGLKDTHMVTLMDFYKCYRAYVRGKIGCFTWASPGIDQQTKDKAKKEAQRYFRLAYRYAGGVTTRPRLYVFFGLSGTGKSTLAQAFAKQKGIKVYNSDTVRKQIVAGIDPTEPRWEPFGKGIYSPEMTERTYRALSRLAGRQLAIGNWVALDATYSKASQREELVRLCQAADTDIRFVLCTCPEDVVKKRLESRKKGGQVSDARWEIYLAQKKQFHPIDHLKPLGVTILDTTNPVEQLVRSL